MREKRTNWDFSKHIHTTEIFKSNNNQIRVDEFKQSGTINGYIRFVNDTCGLSVFGDFGNWIFCRQFHPSAESYVCDHYWCEKLTIGSSQEISKYDSDATEKELKEMIESGLEEYGYQDDILKEGKDWFKKLLSYTDDELEYTYEAFRGSNPTSIDYENIPYVKDTKVRLKIIFDAFDEMCRRMKQNSKKESNE
ncbi:hypothetical protein SAMN04489761_4332 [Tenacibaculum sp. MAR_2009_124]|uniref:hypothetical protein n=1 Tax=Tenacibaculum sp. MAR_2009_124 TaxID=1250059 RepID=UPI000894D977|nr:hypothetical protein [Tenacibaculum sp. MAR_2009_124]SED11956.1 hypothetical protein SAMN04489761_4332 [Tenacibaculum sp. MAR_2009_124]